MCSTVNLFCLATCRERKFMSKELPNDPNNIFVLQCQQVVESSLSFNCGFPPLPSPHPHHTATLVRVVNEFTQLHRKYMVNSLRELKLCSENMFSLYDTIAEAILDDPRPMTWGRVVLLYALAKLMAQLTFVHPTPQIRTFVVHVGDFIEKKTGHWIEHQGGWDSIHQVFGKEEEHHVAWDVAQTVARYALKAFYYMTPIPSVLLRS